MPVTIDPTTGVDVATDAVQRAMQAGADGAKALHTYAETFEVNFDTTDVGLIRSTVTDTMTITVYKNTSKGTSQLTGRSHDEVDAAVAQALAAAEGGAPDPANVLPTDAAKPATSAGDEQPDEDAMVTAVVESLQQLRDKYPLVRSRDASNYAFTNQWTSYANSHGRTQQARRGLYSLFVMGAGKDGERTTSFNYAAVTRGEHIANFLSETAISLLLDELVDSFDPQPVPETFVGDVIFTPAAVGTLVESVADSLSGIALMRHATPFADSLGTAIAAPSFTMQNTASLPASSPFDAVGFANRNIDIVRDGVLSNFIIDWYTGHKLDRPMTTGCADLTVAPGDDALEDIIAKTERGIILGRYSGGQPNSNLDFSGVAKNSFYVEDGKVVGPTTETMVAGNFRSVLENIKAVSRELLNYGYCSYPWIATTGVTISTK